MAFAVADCGGGCAGAVCYRRSLDCCRCCCGSDGGDVVRVLRLRNGSRARYRACCHGDGSARRADSDGDGFCGLGRGDVEAFARFGDLLASEALEALGGAGALQASGFEVG